MLVAVPDTSLVAQSASQELTWGADAEGGAPFVEADPTRPERVVGFEVEVARLIADGLGRTPRFVQAGFTSLDALVARGDFHLAMGGVEDLPARRAHLALTIPYYEFPEVLTVRVADRQRFRTLADLRGRRVATLGSTLAYDLLIEGQATHGITVKVYEDDVHPYTDLTLGRVDAVVLDQVLAERGVRRNTGLVNQPDPLAIGHYVAALSQQNAPLRDQIDDILREAMRDGRLEAIFRRWGLWNDRQPQLYARVAGVGVPGRPGVAQVTGAEPSAAAPVEPHPGDWVLARRYLPTLLRAAVITVVLSTGAMALAVLLGGLIAAGRVYGPSWAGVLLTAWVEIVRGTPLLLQLFVLYFGLAEVVDLPAFLAALLGLGLNYSAYESEIYRGALLAVPAGQLEAARALGLTDLQALRLVRGPQAFRLALAPMTNDFIALLKDTSLVSVITVVELTKQTQIFASNLGSWALPGAMCAALYLVLSLPLASLARRIEASWGSR